MTHLLFFFACSGATDVKDTSVDTGIVEPSTEPSTEPSGEPATEPSSETSTDASFVVFNELLAKSDLTEDWIELYNSSTTDVDLSGLGLIDDIESDEAWLFPDGTMISAGGYLLVWADDAGSEDTQGEVTSSLHATFKLSKDGESVYFVGEDGTVISEVTFPALSAEQSYALQSDGSWIVSDSPTPNMAN